MPGFVTDAILLRKIEYGDHDFIISFLTESKGKISVIAKNAKKSIQRFSGALDLFSVNNIQCTFPKKKKDGLTILSRTDLENGFANIRYDVYKTAYASFWVEVMHFWLEENKQQSGLYNLLLFSLDALNQGSLSREVISLFFQIRFMSLSGFFPNIENCDKCKTPVDHIEQKKVWFDFAEGRIMCQNCIKKRSKYGMIVSKGTLKQINWIHTSDISRADRIKFSNLAIKEGEMLVEAFIPFYIGREFKSLQFLDRLRHEK
ncbi:MAG: DNA repair protein RecO [Desulfobacula sp.]|jgi:DNA repair protein RecO (recombination protein O)|uniref:DNA repair protein RecO n=1 Tax=Desulfobacula sp. TaxID=2593537 RepID=UPI001DBAAEDC|nr:DNA repair protein RecO [Desulfobacula sp.]MBT3487337.1 DNA repair protein RecO [Desulfobacula sp.]MBT3807070.1 DNA repair protein RecO [Desulfobacula sp.]MBT4508325.1 DNA repair protein RecO [Desulfobacula sp.]MBT4874090.1 DNA repair protein RecO [Desulfobacula sp.]